MATSRARLAAIGVAAIGATWIAGASTAAAAEAATTPKAAATPKSAEPTKATERRLHVASAEASSFLVNDWNKFQENYLPLYVGDDDPTTAWTEGAKGDGVGEWLRIKVTPMAGATRVRLRVRNGYQKTDRLFQANERARGVTVVLLPGGAKLDAELADSTGWQELVVDQPPGPLGAVELRVRSIFPGKKYDDLCLSDVQVLVTATTPDNPAFEKARLDQLMTWKKERLAAAKLFRSALGKKLPFAPQYVAGQEPSTTAEEGIGSNPVPCAKEGALCFMREHLRRETRHPISGAKTPDAALARAAAALARVTTFAPVQAVARDRRPIPRVDGLCTPTILGCDSDPCYRALPLPSPGLVGFMNAADVATLEMKAPPTFADVEALKPRECRLAGVKKTFAWVLRDPPRPDGTPSPVQALLLATCGAVSSREGTVPRSEAQLLVYAADGKLETVAGDRYAAVLSWTTGESGPRLAGGWVDGVEIAEATRVAATAP